MKYPESLFLFVICSVLIILTISLIQIKGEIENMSHHNAYLIAEIERLQRNQESYELFVSDFAEIFKNDIIRIESAIDEYGSSGDIVIINHENLLTIIRLVCNWRGFDYRIAYAVALHESGLDPTAIGHNSNGSTDHGLYQFNDVALAGYGITPEIAMNPYTATEYFIVIMSKLIDKYGLYDALRAYAAGERGMQEGGGKEFANEIMKMIDEN